MLSHIYAVVQFYPWFNFNFSLFQTLYHTHNLLYPKTKENKIQTKENNIDYNIYLYMTHGAKKVSQQK